MFYEPVWLTGTFYCVNSLCHSESRKPPKSRNIDIVGQQNLDISGAAPPPHSWTVVLYQPLKPHFLVISWPCGMSTCWTMLDTSVWIMAVHLKGETPLWKSVFMQSLLPTGFFLPSWRKYECRPVTYWSFQVQIHDNLGSSGSLALQEVWNYMAQEAAYSFLACLWGTFCFVYKIGVEFWFLKTGERCSEWMMTITKGYRVRGERAGHFWERFSFTNLARMTWEMGMISHFLLDNQTSV